MHVGDADEMMLIGNLAGIWISRSHGALRLPEPAYC